MIPSTNTVLTDDIEIVALPSVQHRMIRSKAENGTDNRIIGECDRLEAVKQAVYKILNTERYEHAIYSWDYGIELMDLFGESISYVEPELERRITEALLMDDRITDVDEFEFDIPKKGCVHVTFTVHTVFGDYSEEKVVNV